MEIMRQHKIDLIALQETKINHSIEELKVFRNQKYLFRFSSSVNKKTQAPEPQIPKAKAKANAQNNGTEHHGVGFVVGPKLQTALKDCIPYSSRLIQIKFHNHGPDLSFISQYAPHSGRPQEEKIITGKLYKTLSWTVLKILQPTFLVMQMLACTAALMKSKNNVSVTTFLVMALNM